MLNIYVTQLFYQRRKEEFLLALTGEADREWALPGCCAHALCLETVSGSKEEPAVCAHQCTPDIAGQGTSASSFASL